MTNANIAEQRREALYATRTHVAKITAMLDRVSVYPHMNPVAIGFLTFLENIGLWLVRRAERKYEEAQ